MTSKQIQELRKFRDIEGRGWKRKLSDCWMSGFYPAGADYQILQQIRNQYGPSWLFSRKSDQELAGETQMTKEKPVSKEDVRRAHSFAFGVCPKCGNGDHLYYGEYVFNRRRFLRLEDGKMIFSSCDEVEYEDAKEPVLYCGLCMEVIDLDTVDIRYDFE